MSPDTPQWIAAKAEGDRAELAIARWFRERGWEPYRTVDRVAFDLLLQAKVEVKNDRKAMSSGNVAVETHYRDKVSGIYATEAAYWVFVVGETAYIVKVDELRKLVASGDFVSLQAGDQRLATVVLVPIEQLSAIKGVQAVSLAEVLA